MDPSLVLLQASPLLGYAGWEATDWVEGRVGKECCEDRGAAAGPGSRVWTRREQRGVDRVLKRMRVSFGICAPGTGLLSGRKDGDQRGWWRRRGYHCQRKSM